MSLVYRTSRPRIETLSEQVRNYTLLGMSPNAVPTEFLIGSIMDFIPDVSTEIRKYILNDDIDDQNPSVEKGSTQSAIVKYVRAKGGGLTSIKFLGDAKDGNFIDISHVNYTTFSQILTAESATYGSEDVALYTGDTVCITFNVEKYGPCLVFYLVTGTGDHEGESDIEFTVGKTVMYLMAGAQGPQGPQGPQGQPGPQGPQGAQGPAGTGFNEMKDITAIKINGINVYQTTVSESAYESIIEYSGYSIIELNNYSEYNILEAGDLLRVKLTVATNREAYLFYKVVSATSTTPPYRITAELLFNTVDGKSDSDVYLLKSGGNLNNDAFLYFRTSEDDLSNFKYVKVGPNEVKVSDSDNTMVTTIKPGEFEINSVYSHSPRTLRYSSSGQLEVPSISTEYIEAQDATLAVVQDSSQVGSISFADLIKILDKFSGDDRSYLSLDREIVGIESYETALQPGSISMIDRESGGAQIQYGTDFIKFWPSRNNTGNYTLINISDLIKILNRFTGSDKHTITLSKESDKTGSASELILRPNEIRLIDHAYSDSTPAVLIDGDGIHLIDGGEVHATTMIGEAYTYYDSNAHTPYNGATEDLTINGKILHFKAGLFTGSENA